MGQKAIDLFQAQNIEVHVGASLLTTEELVKALINGELDTSNNLCDH